MNLSVVRKWTQLGLVGGATLVLAGCPEDAADITEQASEPSFDFPVASAFVEPVGEFSIDNITLAAFDTTVSDAFGTSVAGNDPFYSSTARGDAADGTDFGPGWNFGGFDRNASTDPRLPALVDNDSDLPEDDGFVIGDAAESGQGPGHHNPFTEGLITGLDPNTTYIVAFFRYGLTVNGELDAGLAARGVPLDAADELVPVGGAPAGDPTVSIEAFPTIIPFQASANPFVLGNFTTDANGDGFFDVVVNGSGNLCDCESGDPAESSFDSTLVARNDDSSTNLPRYNYLVIVEGQGAVTAADAADNPQVMRIQIGQDFLSGSGALINNGYAPFPETFTIPELVGAPGGAGRPDSLTATFNNLKELADGAYEAWLVNPETGSMVPAVGDYRKRQIEIEIDPVTGEVVSIEDTLVVETVTGTASFVGDASGQGFRHDLIISDNTLAPDTLGVHTYLALTTTSSPGGSTMPESRPFWFQFTDQAGTPDNFFDDSFNDSGDTNFGNFNPMNPSMSRIYIGVGQGTGGVRALDRDAATGLVTSGILSVDLQALSRPPVGYVLQGWVVSEDGSQAFPTDPVTGPPPEFVDITTADEETIEGVVTQNGILNANFRLNSAEAGVDFTNFFNFMVTLEPKLGIPDMGPIPVQSGVLPEEATTPPENE